MVRGQQNTPKGRAPAKKKATEPKDKTAFVVTLESPTLEAQDLPATSTVPANPAPNTQKQAIEEEDVEVEDDQELGAAETFEEYRPRKLLLGAAHPDAVVETSSLASVEPKDITYTLALPKNTIDSGALSSVQLEAITYACQAHETFFADGDHRPGFLIGDGAGVGKGRTIAGIILENFLKGRLRSIWISVSSDLKFDAERDLRDIHCTQIQVMGLNKLPYGKIANTFKTGVLFSTYSALVGRSGVKGAGSRLDQILEWCGPDFDGCIIFDESHKAKNLAAEGSRKPTKTGEAVRELQMRLPKARIVYASATGASETRNMAYMVRLGIWGKGSPFKEFQNFHRSCGRSIGVMEIVALDLKRRGMYIARQLSFKGVTFRTEEARITPEWIKVYDDAVDLWTLAWNKFKEAAALVRLDGMQKMTAFAQFWGSHQRFFRYMCMAAKTDCAVEIAKTAIAEGQCVVIGLQSTGEARTLSQLDMDDGELDDFVSGASGVFEALVAKHFPLPDGADRSIRVIREAAGKRTAPLSRPVVNIKKPRRHLILSDSESDYETESEWEWDSHSEAEEEYAPSTSKASLQACHRGRKPQICPQTVVKTSMEMRDQLLKEIEKLGPRLPRNMLDDLIHKLGGAQKVAEMTGRKGRVVKNGAGIVDYESRAEGDVPLEKINLLEKQRFMDGDKLVAIISEAASSGISLQSDRRVPNQRQRVHITMELPWSADRAIQQFGRTHRSNQVNAPQYVFVISDLGGERRFAATVARRLQSLGALTHGDRRATETRDLSAFYLDNKYGKTALTKVLLTIWQSEHDPHIEPPTNCPESFMADAFEGLAKVGLDNEEKRSPDKAIPSIPKFLNRLLGLPVKLQNCVFQYFTDTLSAIISEAKRLDTFDYGIRDLGARDEEVVLESGNTYQLSQRTGDALLEMHTVKVERGLSWEKALELLGSDVGRDPHSGFYINYKSSSVSLLIHTDDNYQIYRPNTGRQYKKATLSEFKNNNYKALLAVSEPHWRKHYDFSLDKCSHYYLSDHCKNILLGRPCYSGMRKCSHTVLSGPVLCVWHIVEGVLAIHNNRRPLQVLRVKTSDKKIVGIRIPTHCVVPLHERLKEEEQSSSNMDNEETDASDDEDVDYEEEMLDFTFM